MVYKFFDKKSSGAKTSVTRAHSWTLASQYEFTCITVKIEIKQMCYWYYKCPWITLLKAKKVLQLLMFLKVFEISLKPK